MRGNDSYMCTIDGHEARFQSVMEEKARRNWNIWSSTWKSGHERSEKYNYCKETGVRSNDSFSRQENLCMCECRRELQTLMYIKGLLLKCTFWFSRSGGKAWNSAFQTSFPMMLQVCGLHPEKQKYRELGIRKRMRLKVWQKKKRWKLEIPRQCSSLVPYIKPCSQQRGTRQYCGVIWGHSNNVLRKLEEYPNQRLI